jgi:hypothetical protein
MLQQDPQLKMKQKDVNINGVFTSDENIAQYKPYVSMTHITGQILIVHYVCYTAPEQ